MGNKEEAEWVLERLTRTLNKELEMMRREELESKGEWAKGGKMGKEVSEDDDLEKSGKHANSDDKEEVANEKHLAGEGMGSASSSRTATDEKSDS
jgi:potassium channel subfamily K